MYCTKCGAKIDNDAAFCEECGNRITKKNNISNLTKTYKEFDFYVSNKAKWIVIILSSVLVCLQILNSYIVGMYPFRHINLYLYVILLLSCILINKINPVFFSIPYGIMAIFAVVSMLISDGGSIKNMLIRVILAIFNVLFVVFFVLLIRQKKISYIKRTIAYRIVILIFCEFQNAENIIRWSRINETRLVIFYLIDIIIVLLVFAIPVIVLLELKKHSEYKEVS